MSERECMYDTYYVTKQCVCHWYDMCMICFIDVLHQFKNSTKLPSGDTAYHPNTFDKYSGPKPWDGDSRGLWMF